MTVEHIGKFSATCYVLKGRTRTGTRTHRGSVAVDPRVIKLGTPLYVEGYGYGWAEDTGSAIQGRRIDVWMDSYNDCIRWGRHTLEVAILHEAKEQA